MFHHLTDLKTKFYGTLVRTVVFVTLLSSAPFTEENQNFFDKAEQIFTGLDPVRATIYRHFLSFDKHEVFKQVNILRCGT